MKLDRKYVNLIPICFFLLASFTRAYAMNDGSRYAESSVLSSGKWVQLKVNKTGIYKLTYDDIRKMGFSDPAKASIYGYGGWILDVDFTKPYVDDLPEVSVHIEKGTDGVFNSGDYLLFYGRGAQKWSYNNGLDCFEHENNPYSTSGSYFITDSGSGPKEMPAYSPKNSPETTITVFDDFALHEVDSLSVLNSGRELFGESFIGSSQSKSFDFLFPGITSDPGKVCLSFAAAPLVATPVSLFIGDERIMSLDINPVTESSRKAYLRKDWRTWSGEKKERISARVTYNSAGQSVALLDFISFNVKRKLQSYNEAFTFFRSKESRGKNSRYAIAGASNSSLVWNVTDNFDTRLVQTTSDAGQLAFSEDASSLVKEYVLVDRSKSFPTPEVIGEIKNQDLHALPQTEYVIISPETFMVQANKLADIHRTRSGLHVTVVQDNWIYNEFSSGVRDATAFRRFMKMFYDRAQTEEEKPKYLMLLGDALYDNRFITPEGKKRNPNNYLVSFQVKESVYEIDSYGTDDYFGFLDDSEGLSLGNDILDLGIGRFPVSSVIQAESAVNKLAAYMDNKQYGNWKNNIIFTADDTDHISESTSGSFCGHAKEADENARILQANHPEYIIHKYYMDAYKPVLVNGKKTYPEAKKSFLSTLSNGCFILNYTGHGSTKAWSSEDMLQVSDVRNMKFENLPLWITATCDFGWFDAINTSAGEEVFLNNNSAGIALVTTSRIVSSYGNLLLNKELMKNLFERIDGKYPRLGDVMRKSKSALRGNTNKLNYVLLGDPALRLNYPEYNVELQQINGIDITSGNEVNLKALDQVTLEGIITDQNGNRIEDFNGSVRSTVYDSKQTIQSIVQGTDGGHFSFTSYPNLIYFGNSDVKDGSFRIQFNVPLDISYTKENGMMNFYAYDTEQATDAKGSFLNYILAGTNENPSINELGPEIVNMFLNTPEFVDGDNVNETPFFYAQVFDEDGINMTGAGLGHDIMISIDDNPLWTYNLNTFYHPATVSEGTVEFSIPALPAGEHTLTFRIWDILNNPSVDSLRFNVVSGMKPQIVELYASINPAKVNTQFILDHNFPETQMDVEIRVYDLTGRSIWSHSEKGSSGYMKKYPVEWNLSYNSGGRVPPGIYIYKAAVSTSTSRMATKAKKIIVLGQ